MNIRKGFSFLVLLLCVQGVWGQQLPNVLRYVENSMPLGLDPITGAGTAIGVRLIDLLFDGMVTYNEYGDPVKSLADTIIFSGSWVIVRLKPGLKWHDGHPITPSDVRYSYNAFIHPKSPYSNKDRFSVIERIEANDKEVRIKFVPGLDDTTMMAMLDFELLPRHRVQAPTVRAGSPFSRNPIGCGPYKLDKVEENKICMTAHRPYHAGGPHIDGVEMYVQPNDAIHSYMVSTGEVDLDPVVRPQDVTLPHKNIRLEPYDSHSWSGIAFNCTNKFLRFEKVRVALTMAFDRESALRSFYAGMGKVISGPFPVSSFAYDHTILPWPNDRMKAKKLLEEMGFVDSDGDNVLEREGEDFELNMVLKGSLPDADKNVCADFQRQLELIGVKVKINYIAVSYTHLTLPTKA